MHLPLSPARLQITAASSKPGVPGRVHAAQVVQTVGCGHQGVDFAFSTLKLGQVVEASHDGCDGFLNQGHQLLGVHILWLSSWGQGHGRVLLGFLVPGNNFIPQDCLQDAIHLSEMGNRDQHSKIDEKPSLFYLCITSMDKKPTWLTGNERQKSKVSLFLLSGGLQVSSERYMTSAFPFKSSGRERGCGTAKGFNTICVSIFTDNFGA